MFEKRKRRRPIRRDYEGMPDPLQSQGPMSGMNPPQMPGRGNGAGIDQYMYRSIMSMLDNDPSTGPSDESAQRRNPDSGEQSGPDSVTFRIEIPANRAEQLRRLARDLDESPQTLARLWVMERLREIGSHASHQPTPSPDGAHDAPYPLPPAFASLSAPAASADIVATTKERLGTTYITDAEEQAIYAETYAVRQWAPYIAALVLNQRGRKLFTLDDIRHVLSQDLMPEVYSSPAIPETEWTLRDVELGKPGSQMRPFACIERVDPGVFSFIGFKKARTLRAGR